LFRLWAAAIFSIATLAIPATNAAQIDYLKINGSITISITGEIVVGDAKALKSAINRATDAGHPIHEIELNSVGGNVREGVMMVRLIHGANLNTNVTFGATCASVCFLAFAAGAEKSVDLAARVGVHAASGELGEKTPASIAGTAAMARIAQTLLVPSAIIEKMLSTPASTVFWLGRSELTAMGATIKSRKQETD
jgi:hypothetical protein